MSFLNKIPESSIAVRQLIKSGQLKGRVTKSFCPGYKQANLAVIANKYADDFLEFIKGNSGALPLLYSSGVGEFDAPSLSKDSDYRTDLPSYLLISNGTICSELSDLTGQKLDDFVCFYIGCSFSFNKILIDHGLLPKIEENLNENVSNVSMFRTNIKNYKSEYFGGKMVVSMRAIKKQNLSLVTQLTFPLDDVHGAPIHYGNPKLIGISDLSNPSYGVVTKVREDEVPVFWCCGVTAVEAIKAAELPLCFTHSPGCMFITDIKQPDTVLSGDPCDVIEYKHDLYGVLSTNKLAVLKKLSDIAGEDLGNRGISELRVAGDFEKASIALSYSSSVAITTGFPVNKGPLDETDGLPGAISLCCMLTALGKSVTLISDEHNFLLYSEVISKCFKLKLLKSKVEVVSAKSSSLKANNFDVILATERAGRSSDGRYYSMKGRDVTDDICSEVDDFFLEGFRSKDVVTIGIGDGGNEVGMGKVENVIKKLGIIPSTTKSDLLITCGVSNWGCYALAFSLYLVLTCQYHERHLRKAVGFPVSIGSDVEENLPSIQREKTILSIVESFGVRDGISPDQQMSVDGMFFDNEHTDILLRMKDCLSDK